MTFTGQHHQLILGCSAHLQGTNSTVSIAAKSTECCATIINTVSNWHTNHTEDHLTALNQCDVDRILSAATNKLFGTIKRINQPPTRPLLTFAERNSAIFFREYWNTRI